MRFFSHNDGHYRLPKYSPFFLDHSMYADLSLISTVSSSGSFDFGNEVRIFQNRMSMYYFVFNPYRTNVENRVSS